MREKINIYESMDSLKTLQKPIKIAGLFCLAMYLSIQPCVTQLAQNRPVLWPRFQPEALQIVPCGFRSDMPPFR